MWVPVRAVQRGEGEASPCCMSSSISRVGSCLQGSPHRVSVAWRCRGSEHSSEAVPDRPQVREEGVEEAFLEELHAKRTARAFLGANGA